MSSVATRLAQAGHLLPSPPDAVGRYVPARRVGRLVFTAGQLPMRDGALMTSGHVGAQVDEETAQDCAAQAALNALAAAATVCDLDEVEGVARLTGYVSSCAGFTRQPAVIDGASEIMEVAFGAERGRHARVALGVAELPMGAPVEVEIVLALAPDPSG
jgi:enamine deaminase RidA (YjgF/YER057c/UK114 family)